MKYDEAAELRKRKGRAAKNGYKKTANFVCIIQKTYNKWLKKNMVHVLIVQFSNFSGSFFFCQKLVICLQFFTVNLHQVFFITHINLQTYNLRKQRTPKNFFYLKPRNLPILDEFFSPRPMLLSIFLHRN